MPLLALVIVLPIAIIAVMPLILWQRYRIGHRRRLVRPWVARANVVAMILSAVMFLLTAALIDVWVPTAFVSAATGLAIGAGLGVVGLWLSRWETARHGLHYTPNRWLVLAITLLVAARILYGIIRAIASLAASSDSASALTAVGVPGSLAVGALVIGYYLSYALGVRRRVRRWQNGR